MRCVILSAVTFICLWTGLHPVQAAEGRQKPRLILHLGPIKTGSSALQTFLACQVTQLKKSGILYPFAPRVSAQQGYTVIGNMENLYAQCSEYTNCTNNSTVAIDEFFDRLQKLVTADVHTIILSQEAFCGIPGLKGNLFYLKGLSKQQLSYFFKRAAQEYSVTTVLFVRELYSWIFSVWAQWVKSSTYYLTHLQNEDDTEDGLRETDFFLFARSLFSFLKTVHTLSPKTVVVNYDTARKDLLKVFFREAGLVYAVDSGGMATVVNRSLSSSEHNLLMAMNKAKLPPSEMTTLGYQFIDLQNKKPSFYYYREELAKRLYKRFAADIQLLNNWLPPETPLPTKVHQPRGFSTVWDSRAIDAGDLKLLLNRYKTLLERPTKKPSFFVRVKRYIKRKLNGILS